MSVDAGEGQFKLSFRGQTTADIAYNATPAAVQAGLRALPKIGSSGVNVSGTPQAYEVTFAGGLAGTNVEPLKSSNGTTPLGGGGGVSASTTTEGGTNHPVSIEAHIEHLTIGSTYHFRIFATNAAEPNRALTASSFPRSPPKDHPAPTNSCAKKTTPSACPNAAPTRWSPLPTRKALPHRCETFRRRGSTVAYKSGSHEHRQFGARQRRL